jgi:glycosyltransferase involved in cell wall biosynthesis
LLSMNTVMLLGPSLKAVSGVSTHLNLLFQSRLAEEFNLLHFQVGSEGRDESVLQKMMRFLFSPFQFLGRLIQKNPQIVHVNTSMDPKGYWRDLVYLAIALSLGKKIVYQVHGGASPQKFFENSRLASILLRQVLRSADVVVLLGQDSLRAYRNFSPDLNLEVIPNAIEPVADPEWKRVPSAQYRPLQLAYVGRLAESKGVFEIIEALGILHKRGEDMQLTIAGDGPDEGRLRARVEDLGLQRQVRFVGVVHGIERDRVWNESDLFVFPTYHEALPYALLESMAARTPALVSCVGAIPDVMEDGVHGLFVPLRNPQALAEAICRLDNDRALIRRMGESSRQRIVNYYTIDRLADDFGRTYLDILK